MGLLRIEKLNVLQFKQCGANCMRYLWSLLWCFSESSTKIAMQGLVVYLEQCQSVTTVAFFHLEDNNLPSVNDWWSWTWCRNFKSMPVYTGTPLFRELRFCAVPVLYQTAHVIPFLIISANVSLRQFSSNYHLYRPPDKQSTCARLKVSLKRSLSSVLK